MNEGKIKQSSSPFNKKSSQVMSLFIAAFEMYTSESCQCAYPRYQQLIGIDCTSSENSFVCYDTEILINLSKPYFNIETSQLSDESTNETWRCKKCGSTYEYGWSDLSIHVERQKLKLTNLTTISVGKAIKRPIPLYLGLAGHSYPSKTEMIPVDFREFENYILEK